MLTRRLFAGRDAILKVCKLNALSVRCHAPLVGPPRFPMSGAKKLLIGGGSLCLMMIIPMWALFSVPRWSAMHRGVPYERYPTKKCDEDEIDEECADKNKDKDKDKDQGKDKDKDKDKKK